MIITVSREAASNGGAVGRLVAEKLGYKVYDRELVEEIARRLQVNPDTLQNFDEAAGGFVQSLLLEWRTSLNESTYARYLREALRRILAEGNGVIIGRGANFVLKCPACLHVRIVAPLELRIGIYQAIYNVSDHEAEHRIRKEDAEKSAFIRRMYHHNIDDPAHYDLTLNLAGLTPEMAVEIVIHAAQLRTAGHLPAESVALLPRHVAVMARHRRPVRPEVIERHRSIV